MNRTWYASKYVFLGTVYQVHSTQESEMYAVKTRITRLVCGLGFSRTQLNTFSASSPAQLPSYNPFPSPPFDDDANPTDGCDRLSTAPRTSMVNHNAYSTAATSPSDTPATAPASDEEEELQRCAAESSEGKASNKGLASSRAAEPLHATLAELSAASTRVPPAKEEWPFLRRDERSADRSAEEDGPQSAWTSSTTPPSLETQPVVLVVCLRFLRIKLRRQARRQASGEGSVALG